MKIVGKVYKVDDLISGQSDNGNDWEKQTVVVQTMEERPRLLAVDFMGQRKTAITQKLVVGQLVEAVATVESREYNDKWYTKLDGISITPYAPATVQGEIPLET